MNKSITTSIRIQATRETIWQILLDFEQYPVWNTFIKSITGKVEEQSKLIVELEGMKFSPIVQVYDIGAELTWLGHLWIKGLFDGEHRFYLTDNGDGTTEFEQSEKFSGILVKFLEKKIDKEIKQGFNQMNLELKLRAERMQKEKNINAIESFV